ncbi:MAG TPA: helix-hairpin-helix domain-containing protein [Candidatus Acidoferrum sp.]|nr:helix-hairpin-helix domain-containing protein [Candidatus Acidoferrum sp.]
MNFATKPRCSNLAVLAFAVTAIFAAGCGYFQKGGSDAAAQKERDEKTREEVANAVENAKPKLQEAGRKVGEAAKVAADDARAAAQGVKEGWDRGGHAAVDLNSASEADLVALPGISHRDARKIIEHRPYGDKHDLVSKGVLTEERYGDIRDAVTAK